MAGVLLDNAAVQALADPRHRKHRATLAIVQMALGRRRQLELVIPTAVQVEAGWDGSEPSAAALNRIRARRPPLDGPAADRAAAMVRALRISVADAHIADVLASPDSPDVVLTSDTDDLGRILAYTGARVRIVRLSTAPQLHERAEGPELVGSGPSITAILTSVVGCVSPNYSALRDYLQLEIC